MKPEVYEQPEDWLHLQHWYNLVNDPIRPWNVSAISRHFGMSHPLIRSLLTAPKDSDGFMRASFTSKRLAMFQEFFRPYGYVPLPSEESSLAASSRRVSPPVAREGIYERSVT